MAEYSWPGPLGDGEWSSGAEAFAGSASLPHGHWAADSFPPTPTPPSQLPREVPGWAPHTVVPVPGTGATAAGATRVYVHVAAAGLGRTLSAVSAGGSPAVQTPPRTVAAARPVQRTRTRSAASRSRTPSTQELELPGAAAPLLHFPGISPQSSLDMPPPSPWVVTVDPSQALASEDHRVRQFPRSANPIRAGSAATH